MLNNIYKYYKEIRNRFIITITAWGFCLGICYLYKETILFTLIILNSSFVNSSVKPYFIFTEVTEIFNVYLILALFIANQIGIFFLLYQSFMFLILGLYNFELIKIKFGFKIFIISWLFSLCLLYNLIIPFSWNFFISFQENSANTQPFSLFFEAKLIDYLRYFINIYYICLMSCQFLGILTIILTSLNEKLKQTKTFRKLFYLIFVAFSTIITPPDVISQICVSVSLITIYEVLLLIKFIQISAVTN